MDSVNIFNQILDFAIEREIEANEFYLDLASKMENRDMARVFEGFAAEELGHKTKLQSVKTGKMELAVSSPVKTLNLSDYIVEAPVGPEMTYQQALVLAMQKEKAAYKLYVDLASNCADPALSQVFLAMATEEAKHKLRFEIEYDDNVLKED